MRKQIKRKEGFMKGLFNRKLLKNKLYSLAIMLLGYISIHLTGGDITVFVLTLFLGLPVFFAKKNVIV